ncbi:Tyrosine-protein phosphatase YVH1 [Wickerhamomyces ciferrii]|uniref:protein-tyrosine-phosphatase n=1 Tax=Wickerhamomyces ciferrii (strain ATCC 14091 / BCRC 22168 / CBS 111 / JCM 3599 / NBRC 0793 / NRRL Y-1031 F-60-10) TaxID=1206466 RepID=K0KNG1_WICCF|nr:Tyrosine-protein phosphatase YVH1 [Wickerhamomyces ciferrii]CCH42934.1 Tyrosine-protein phosphatase YVH1 [Wickerhamomyces ciferrii]
MSTVSNTVDRVLGGLYIGSYLALDTLGDSQLKENHISHIISVFQGELPEKYQSDFTTKSIPIDDDEFTNIIQYFDETNQFLNHALFPDEGDSIQRGIKKAHKTCALIMCQAGVSRSSTILAAYLMKKYNLNPDQAIHAIKRKRSIVQPNENFKEQLDLYYELDCELDQTSPIYRQWELQHSLKSDPTGQSILSKDSTFVEEDESTAQLKTDQDLKQLRCKRCRQKLALSTSFVDHIPPSEDSKQAQFVRKAPNLRRIISAQAASNTCSHYFVEPLNWMKEELQGKQELEGKFQCPKCETKVGGYSWKGSRCSCGKWMVPAIHLQRAKVDEIKLK